MKHCRCLISFGSSNTVHFVNEAVVGRWKEVGGRVAPMASRFYSPVACGLRQSASHYQSLPLLTVQYEGNVASTRYGGKEGNGRQSDFRASPYYMPSCRKAYVQCAGN